MPTFLRSDVAVARIAVFEPFSAVEPNDGDTRHIAFLGQATDPAAVAAVDKLANGELANDEDLLHVDGRELYWLRRGRFSDSTITGAMLHKALAGRPSTIRNANTVRKIAAKFPP